MLHFTFSIVLLFPLLSFAFDWQGHRGARGLYPENTIGAMEEALKYPVTTLELDVVITSDNQVVVSHEPWMSESICLNPENKRIKEHEFKIYKMTYEEVLKFDCGSLPNPDFPSQQKVSVGKPLLDKLLSSTEETLKKLNRSDVRYNIEIKSLPEFEKHDLQPDHKYFTDLVMTVIKNHLKSSRYTIQSFDYRVLKYLHKKYPDVSLVALNKRMTDPQTLKKELGFLPQVFSPQFRYLTKDLIKDYQILGVKVIPWTVNSVDEMKSVKNLGVDGIITDYPNLISSVGIKVCPKKYNLFEGSCVEVPAHAKASEQNPGWKCDPGYIQKRNRCVKIKVPRSAHLLEDGKTWVCNDGYERYRGMCRRK